MSKVLPFKNPAERRQQLRETAAQWIARLDAGASPAEVEQVGAWLAQDAEHYRVFMSLAYLWDRASILEDLSRVYPLNEYPPGAEKPGGFRRRRVLVGGALAASLVVMGTGYAAYRYSSASAHAFDARYTTAVGEQRTIDLPDGSAMTLNTDTVLRVAFTGAVRALYLEQGEGLFHVAKNRQRPFQVFAGDKMVEAVGTAFSVNRKTLDAMEVVVSEGRVRLYRQQGDAGSGARAAGRDAGSEHRTPELLSLSAGQYVSISALNADTAVPIDIPATQVEEKLSWQHGILLFRDTPLQQMLEEVARYTTTDIEAAPEIRDVRVGGYFRVDDIDGLLGSIENNFQIKATHIDANHIYLAPQ